MGSLVPGWDSRRGKCPKGFRDYEDPSPLPKDIRDLDTKHKSTTGQPNLKRVSAPTFTTATNRHPTVLHRTSATTPKTIDVARAPSFGSPSSPRSPGSPGSPHILSASPQKTAHCPPVTAFRNPSLTPLSPEELHDKSRSGKPTDVLKLKEHWCDRVDSAGLNDRIDCDFGQEQREVWAHGTFVPDDPMHSLHAFEAVKDHEAEKHKAHAMDVDHR